MAARVRRISRPQALAVTSILALLVGVWIGATAHAALIALFLVTPALAFKDITERRLPEALTLPWLCYELGAVVARLPNSTSTLIGAVSLGTLLLGTSLAGAARSRHLLGLGDVVVVTAVLLTLPEDSPIGPFIPTLTIAVAALLAWALQRVDRANHSRGLPLGGSLVIVASCTALPTLLR